MAQGLYGFRDTGRLGVVRGQGGCVIRVPAGFWLPVWVRGFVGPSLSLFVRDRVRLISSSFAI